jgi:hypothetical protein
MSEDEALIAQALFELSHNNKAWKNLHYMYLQKDPEWREWWWRVVQKIDIPTWQELRAKVVTLKLTR